MTSPEPETRHPMAVAMEWVSRIMAAGVMMVAPGLLGQWLDGKLGTRFLVLIGFAFGLSASLYYLVRITKQPPRSTKKSKDREKPGNSSPLNEI